MTTHPAPEIVRRTSLTRDLVSVGVFTALYLVVHVACSMIGVISPLVQPFGAAVSIVLNGITVALFVARVQRRGMLTLLVLVTSIVVTLLGDHPVRIVAGVLCGVLAELVLGSRDRTRRFVPAYAVLSLWHVAGVLPLLFMRDQILSSVSSQMGPDYARTFSDFLSPATIAGLGVVYLVCGVLGGLLGRRFLTRHFTRAGLA